MPTNYHETHKYVFKLFAGYLNQSWKEIYIWDGQEPSYPPVVRKLKTELSGEELEETVKQLKEVITAGKDSDEEGWMDILTWDLNLGYYPPGDGLTYEEWLEEVLKILEEPIEEISKHFIPERI